MVKKRAKSKRKGKKKTIEIQLPSQEDYETEIIKLNRILGDLRKKATVFYDENVELIKKKDEVNLNRSEINDYFNRISLKQNDKFKEYLVKLKNLTETFKAEKKTAAQKLVDDEKEFKKWNNILESDERILRGNILFYQKPRQEFLQLMQKKKIFEKLAINQNQVFYKEIYDKEREIVIYKHELAQEVQRRLKLLATNYENTSGMRISSFTKYIIRENIALNWEMDRLLSINQRLQKLYDENNQKRTDINNDCKITEAQNQRLNQTKENQETFINILNSSIDVKTHTLGYINNNEFEFQCKSMELFDKEMTSKNLVEKFQRMQEFRDEILRQIQWLERKLEKIYNKNLELTTFFNETKQKLLNNDQLSIDFN